MNLHFPCKGHALRLSIAWLSILAGARAQALDLTPYFPVVSGTRWVYQCSDSRGARARTPVVITQSDAATVRFEQDDPQCARDRSYALVVDPTQFALAEAIGIDSRTTLTPAVRYLPRNALPGERHTSSGAVNYTDSLGTFAGTYESIITLDGAETVTTPVGTFKDVVKVSRTLDLTLTAGNRVVKRSGTYVSWFAKDVGEVKYETRSSGDGSTYSLTLLLQCSSLLGACPGP